MNTRLERSRSTGVTFARSLRSRLLLMGLLIALIPVLALLGLGVQQIGRTTAIATDQVQTMTDMTDRELDAITLGVYRMVAAVDDKIQETLLVLQRDLGTQLIQAA